MAVIIWFFEWIMKEKKLVRLVYRLDLNPGTSCSRNNLVYFSGIRVIKIKLKIFQVVRMGNRVYILSFLKWVLQANQKWRKVEFPPKWWEHLAGCWSTKKEHKVTFTPKGWEHQKGLRPTQTWCKVSLTPKEREPA